MSRTFSKILVICAMVVILPLMAIGTALAAYSSIGSTITLQTFVDARVNEDCPFQTYARVKCGGDAGNELTITKGHTQEVAISADYTSNAYKFLGWFKGDAQAYQNAKAAGSVELESEETLQVKMADEGTYTAVYEIVKYDVSYNYETSPEGTTSTTAPAGFTTKYNYGDELPTPDTTATLESNNDEYYFAGWSVNNNETVRYYYAAFENVEGPITLTSPWLPKTKVILTFKAEGYADASRTANEGEEYNFADVDGLTDLFADFKAENGYAYSWIDANGTEQTSVTPIFGTEYVFTLTKTPVVYTANLTYDQTKLAEGTTLESSVEFTVGDTSALATWLGSVKTKYEKLFVVDGLKLSGESTVYTADKLNNLAARFATKNPHATATAEISLEISITVDTFKVTNGIGYQSGSVSASGLGRFNGDVYGSAGLKLSSKDNYEQAVAEETSIYTILNLLSETYYADASHDQPLKLYAILVHKAASDNANTVAYTEEMTAYDFIEILLERNIATLSGKTLTIYSLDVQFVNA